MRKVVLIGYMGSGKSVISKKLSQLNNFSVKELDELIEENNKMSIEEIFDKKGEIFFRKQEHLLFNELLNSDKNIIISTGGGTPCYYNNHLLLNNEIIISIYLKASVDTLYNRLLLEKQKRPLLSNVNNDALKEYIAKHLFDRSFYYNQATYVINVDAKTVDEIVNEIASLLS